MKKVCIIGFGGMGKRHASDMEEFSAGKITVDCVVEPSENRYAEGCEWLGHAPQRFDTIAGMLRSTQPDGIVLSTPNFMHLSCLEELAGRQIPLLLEKPLETSLEKVFEVARFAETYAAPIMVHHVMRYAPIIRRARELLQGGAIGKVGGFTMAQFVGGSMFHTFRRTFETGGGQLLEKATHDFDVLLYLTGARPTRVASLCRRQYYGGDRPDDLRCRNCEDESTCRHSRSKAANEDAVRRDDLCVYSHSIDIYDREDCLIEMDSGLTGTYGQCFFGNWAPFSRRYEFTGSTGFLSIDLSGKRLTLVNPDGQVEEKFDYHKRIHYNGSPGVTAHFLELMEGTASEIISPVRDALDAELIAFGSYRSNECGRFVNMQELAPRASTPLSQVA